MTHETCSILVQEAVPPLPLSYNTFFCNTVYQGGGKPNLDKIVSCGVKDRGMGCV